MGQTDKPKVQDIYSRNKCFFDIRNGTQFIQYLKGDIRASPTRSLR